MTSYDNFTSPYDELFNKDPALAKKYDAILQNAKGRLSASLNPVAMNTWFTNIYLVYQEGRNLYLYIENDFQRDVVSTKYGRDLKAAFGEIVGGEPELHFLKKDDPLPVAQSAQGQEESPVSYDYEYTFDTFIVGNSNRFAHAASLNVATSPAKSYNPLFIYGGSGLGKTHLLYAIMNQIRKSFPRFKIAYIKGDDFANELILSIQSGTSSDFRAKYRNADILLVDDIQFLAGMERTQQEFFHTFNTLYEAKKQIVLTSDRPPKEISTLEERLRTRFEWGLLADIQPPDFETRIAIIKRKAQSIGLSLSDEIVSLIANSLKSNIRQLEGSVKRLYAYSHLTGQAITPEIAVGTIRDIATDLSKQVSPERIIEEVASFYNVSPEDIKGKKRTNEIVLPRQVSMYILKTVTDFPLAKIGQFFNRDHSTVIHSIDKVEEDIGNNIRFKQTVSDLIKNLKEN